MSYSDKLKDPRWQKKRLEILNRDNFTCKLCGDTETELHIHHVEYKGEPWEQENDKLDTLCKHCHFCLKHSVLKYEEITGCSKKLQIPIESELDYLVIFLSNELRLADELLYSSESEIFFIRRYSYDFFNRINKMINDGT